MAAVAPQPDQPADLARRTRKRGADRVEQMLDIADRQINASRTGALSMQLVSDEAGVSRALIYAYFPDLPHLLDAVLARHVAKLQAAGIERSAEEGTAIERVRKVADTYLRHSVQHGAAMEYVLREPGIARQLDGQASALRARIMKRLTRALRRELRLSAHEAMVFVQLLEVLPTEGGRLVRDGQLVLEDALEVCHRMLESSIEAVRPL